MANGNIIRVVIVDDEPNILQGLKVLIDWKEEGCEIVYTADDGLSALNWLRENTADLVLVDIQMPVMDGLEMLRIIKEEKISKATFVILSGYNDFSFAQQALRLGCMDYLLKPVDKDSLLPVVRKISDQSQELRRQQESQKKLEKAYLERVFILALHGRADEQMMRQIVSQHPWMEGPLRYVSVEYVGDTEENNEVEERPQMESFYQLCQTSIPGETGICLRDFSQEHQRYEIGMILPAYLVTGSGPGFINWLRNLKHALENQGPISICFLAGKMVNGLENLSKSYTSCILLHSMTAFRQEKELWIYEEELQIRGGSISLHKTLMDQILEAVKEQEKEKISPLVSELYQEFERAGLNSDSFKLNIHYLLFQLVHLASGYDDKVDQAYVAAKISDNSFAGDVRGGSRHLEAFLLEYANYLAQLSRNTSSTVLSNVEREIKENYAQNLTLRGLGERYYLNSSYLGQIFRRKYGISFKDYLNQVRIQAATELLLLTDKTVTVIAEEIGYKDKNYFLRKFIELKGCTPTKYRRSHLR